MTKNIFEIRSARCSYSGSADDIVLYIENLDIPKGEVVFLLGASGSGKSTLLEILGLMNNTLVSGDITFFPGDEVISYKKLWADDKSEELSRDRRAFMSFIFQETNLMDNFTAYENICLSSMIQKDANQSEAMAGAKELMQRVGMPIDQISETTLASNLSGGQRQRVAFVRALNSGFSVLFGDEPTGNLDEKNANALIRIIKENIQPHTTAIIVSHDIDLALNHASKIVCLSRSKTHNYSEILQKNIFEREHWENLDVAKLRSFKGKIRSLYDIDLSTRVADVADDVVVEIKEKHKIKYKQLFLVKEGRSLTGKGYTNLIALMAILSITLLAIGFANGSLEYLNKKLNDPFVNWITITIPQARADQTDKMLQVLNSDEIKKEYSIKSVLTYKEQALGFKNNKDNMFNQAEGRSVQLGEYGDDPMIIDIMKESNRIYGDEKGFRSPKDLSIIVTEKFLKQFNYDLETPIVYFDNPVKDTLTNKWVSLSVPISIRGVVKEMPGKVDFIYSLYFLQAYLQTNECTFDIRQKHDIKIIVNGDQNLANSVIAAVKDFFVANTEFSKYDPLPFNPAINKDTYKESYEFLIGFYPWPESDNTINQIYDKLINSVQMKPFKKDIFRLYRYDDFSEDFSQPPRFDIMSVNFEKLDNVRKFGSYISYNFNSVDERKLGNLIEVDLANIREKENFLFLSNTAKIISFLVLIFGLITVILFISNLLKAHLSKIKMNIGTYKAFGLADKDAQNIYFIIILRFILLGLIASFVFSFGAGLLINAVLKEYIFIEDNNSFFKLIDSFTFFSIFVIIGSGILVSWYTVNRMLNKSPGDLIFNRGN
ncbi:MAG: ATP-binding cassette domain-containing protein [Bacteroidota bacterium]